MVRKAGLTDKKNVENKPGSSTDDGKMTIKKGDAVKKKKEVVSAMKSPAKKDAPSAMKSPNKDKKEKPSLITLMVTYEKAKGGFEIKDNLPLQSLVKSYVETKWVGRSPELEFLYLRKDKQDENLDLSKTPKDYELKNMDVLVIHWDEENKEKELKNIEEDDEYISRRIKEDNTRKKKGLESSLEPEGTRKKGLVPRDEHDIDGRYRCPVKSCTSRTAIERGFAQYHQYKNHILQVHHSSTYAMQLRKEKKEVPSERMTVNTGVAKGWKIYCELEANAAETRTHDSSIKWKIEDPKGKNVYSKFKGEKSVESLTTEAEFTAIHLHSRTLLAKLKGKRKHNDLLRERSRSRSRSPEDGLEEKITNFKRTPIDPSLTPEGLGAWLLEQPIENYFDGLRSASSEIVSNEISGKDLCDWKDGKPNLDKLQKLDRHTRSFLNKYLLKGGNGKYECGCSAHLIRHCSNTSLPELVHLGPIEDNKKHRFYRPYVPGVEGEIPIYTQNDKDLICISRQNGFIQARNDRFVLAENSNPSKNGIFVNNEKIEMAEHSDGFECRRILQHGDILVFGGNNSTARDNFSFMYQENI